MEEKIKEVIENLIAQLPKNKRSISICYEKCVDSSGGSNASLQQVTNKLYSLLAYKFPINAKRSDAKIICEISKSPPDSIVEKEFLNVILQLETGDMYAANTEWYKFWGLVLTSAGFHATISIIAWIPGLRKLRPE